MLAGFVEGCVYGEIRFRVVFRFVLGVVSLVEFCLFGVETGEEWCLFSYSFVLVVTWGRLLFEVEK